MPTQGQTVDSLAPAHLALRVNVQLISRAASLAAWVTWSLCTKRFRAGFLRSAPVSVDLHAPGVSRPSGNVDELSPETFTPDRGMSCGQVFLKPPPAFDSERLPPPPGCPEIDPSRPLITVPSRQHQAMRGERQEIRLVACRQRSADPNRNCRDATVCETFGTASGHLQSRKQEIADSHPMW